MIFIDPFSSFSRLGLREMFSSAFFDYLHFEQLKESENIDL